MARRGAPPMRGLVGQLGGKLNPGESLFQAARREVFEESGVEVEAIQFEFVMETYLEETSKRYRLFLVTATAYKNEPQVTEPEKTLEVGWYEMKDFPPSELTTGTREFFRRLATGSLQEEGSEPKR